MQPQVFVQVGAGAEGGGTVAAGVRLLAAVRARVLGEPGGDAEALTANPAAEGSQAAVDALVVLEVGQLAEALATGGALEGGDRKVCHTSINQSIIINILITGTT